MKTDFLGILKNMIAGAGKSTSQKNFPWQTAATTLELLLPEGWPAGTGKISWCLRKDGNIIDEGETGKLVDLEDKARGAYVLAWAPARDVLLARASIPSRRKSRIEQALPYVLEDVLLKDIETQHISYTASDLNSLAVAIINKNIISAWVDEFRQLNIPVRALLPLPLGLPVRDNSIAVFRNDGQLWLRSGEYSGMLLPSRNNDELPKYIKMVLKESERNRDISVIDIYNMEPDTDWTSWHKDLELEIKSGHQPVFNVIHPANCPLNLMHGRYTIQVKKETRPLYRLKPAAVLSATGIILMFALQLFEAWELSMENTRLQKEMLALYKRTFPEEKVIRDPYLQMQQKFNSTAITGTGGSLFISLLGRTSELLKSSNAFELATISYNDRKITLNIGLNDYAALDQLKNKAREYGLAVEVLSANRRDNRIAGRIRIGEA